MPQSDLTFLSVHQLALALASRRLSPVELTEAYLSRIQAQEPKLQAFVEVYADDARLAARGAEAAIRSGHAVGPLHGIPIALKDLIEIEGRIVTGGSEVWRHRKATRTATLVRRLLAQGMIVLGKTHTVEFAMGGWGTNSLRGTPWNPWDPQRKRTPGGSSSGSGVAVAAGLAPWAVGTDTGGSVRLPSSWCGITGLKTTIGRACRGHGAAVRRDAGSGPAGCPHPGTAVHRPDAAIETRRARPAAGPHAGRRARAGVGGGARSL
jgi:aspartyl-tRNA(Asn)/glutamyl-tRNA(Gln) amidotransferase subunit A